MALAVALIALSALDLVVTDFAVTHMGAVEMNPLVAPMLGTPWAAAVKVGLPAAILLLATRIRSHWVLFALRTLVAVYVVVALVNLGQFIAVVA